MQLASSPCLHIAMYIVLIKIDILFNRNLGAGQSVPEYKGEVTANNLVMFVVMIILMQIIEIAVVTLGVKKETEYLAY